MKYGLMILALLGSLLSGVSHAAVLNGIQNQVIDGQDFIFNFNGLSASDGTGGTLVLHARGDFDGGSDEALTWNIDGLVFGGPVGGFVGGCGGSSVGGPFDFCTVFQELGNIEWQRTYALSAAELDALLGDAGLSIFVDFADSVGLFDGPNYIEVTLSYAEVPEPASLLLLGGALAALSLRRRH